MLSDECIRLTRSGLSIQGPWGNFQPLGGLGDGFQATLAWLVDLLGWAMLYQDAAAPGWEVAGIVLIDELEQHLHPRWQRKIIGLLRQQLPNVQFVATTHTPMCAIGTTELSDDECELIVLEQDGPSVSAVQDLQPPRRQWADQVLTSRLFNLPTAGDDATVRDIRRYNELKTKGSLTDEELAEVDALQVSLADELGGAETGFEDIVRRAVAHAMRSKRDTVLAEGAVEFEVLRQMRDMLRT